MFLKVMSTKADVGHSGSSNRELNVILMNLREPLQQPLKCRVTFLTSKFQENCLSKQHQTSETSSDVHNFGQRRFNCC